MISTNDKRDSGAKFTSPEFYPQKQRDLSRKTLNGFLYTYLSLTIFLCVLFKTSARHSAQDRARSARKSVEEGKEK